jgi:hypothetical protein
MSTTQVKISIIFNKKTKLMGVPAIEPPFLAQVVQYLALPGYTRKRSQPLSQALPLCNWVAFVRHDIGQRFAKIVLATDISSSAQTKITLMHTA